MEVSLYSVESILPYYIRGVSLIILIARTKNLILNELGDYVETRL